MDKRGQNIERFEQYLSRSACNSPACCSTLPGVFSCSIAFLLNARRKGVNRLAVD